MLVHGHMRLLPGPQQQQLLPRRSQAIVCRHDTRKSANNAEERRQQRPRSLHERIMDPKLLYRAKSSIAYQRASALCGATSGKLSLQLCLFLFTEQPQLLGLGAQLLAGRIAALADVTGLSLPDAAELVARNKAVLDVLPLRLNAAAESLALALGLSKAQALVMLACDHSLLNVPALRVRQQLEALGQLLGQPAVLLGQLSAGCPHLLRVEASAVQIRWSNLARLLCLPPASPELQQLLQQEPRLLMPSSSTLTQNHAAICAALRIAPGLLNCWLRAAPMLLLVPAPKLKKRLRGLLSLLWYLRRQLGVQLVSPDAAQLPAAAAAAAAAAASGGFGGDGQPHRHDASAAASPSLSTADDEDDDNAYATYDVTDESLAGVINSSGSQDDVIIRDPSDRPWTCLLKQPDQVSAFVSKDPRLLLLSPQELLDRLQVVQQELACGLQLLLWLALGHPSYLVVEPGAVSAWAADVRHLTQMSSKQASSLVACPQVFLTMTPEEVLLSVNSLSTRLQLPHPSTLHIVAQAPLLLVQHPAATTAATQQLQKLVTDPRSLKQLLLALPELLLLGPRVWQVMQETAAVLSLSSAQLAVLLTTDASLWHVMVPRDTWRQQQQQLQQQQQQQQQRSPGLVAAAAAMAAVTSCGLRPPAVMQQAVIAQPGLLQLSPAAVQQQVQQLLDICSRSEGWQQQLQFGLVPELLGKAILKMPGWHRFLEFFVETGLSRVVTLHDVMEMRRADFTKSFHAEYLDWRKLKNQQLQLQHHVALHQHQQQQQQWQQHDIAEHIEAWQQQQQRFAALSEEQRLLLHRRWLLNSRLWQPWLPAAAAARSQHLQHGGDLAQQQQQEEDEEERERDGFQQHQNAQSWRQQQQPWQEQEQQGWDLLVHGMQSLSRAAATATAAAGVSIAEPSYAAAADRVSRHHRSSGSPAGGLHQQQQQPWPQQQQQHLAHQQGGAAGGRVIYLDDEGSYEVIEGGINGSSSGGGGGGGSRFDEVAFQDGFDGDEGEGEEESNSNGNGAPAAFSGIATATAAAAGGGQGGTGMSGASSEAFGRSWQQQERRRHVRAKGYGPAATRAELALQAAQWSAFEMYGSWHGCLVQPAVAGGSAAAAGAGGDAAGGVRAGLSGIELL